MLTPNDARNALVLLERIQLSAKEVDVYVEVRAKLRQLSVEPESMPATDEATTEE